MKLKSLKRRTELNSVFASFCISAWLVGTIRSTVLNAAPTGHTLLYCILYCMTVAYVYLNGNLLLKSQSWTNRTQKLNVTNAGVNQRHFLKQYRTEPAAPPTHKNTKRASNLWKTFNNKCSVVMWKAFSSESAQSLASWGFPVPTKQLGVLQPRSTEQRSFWCGFTGHASVRCCVL